MSEMSDEELIAEARTFTDPVAISEWWLADCAKELASRLEAALMQSKAYQDYFRAIGIDPEDWNRWVKHAHAAKAYRECLAAREKEQPK